MIKLKEKSFTKVCKRCNKLYETPYKHGKICLKCSRTKSWRTDSQKTSKKEKLN